MQLRQRDLDAMAIDLRMPVDVLSDELNALMDATRTHLPRIAGTIAVGVAAASAVVLGVPAIVHMLSDSPAATETQTNVEGNVAPVQSLHPSSGTYVNPAGNEIQVTFGGAPAPPPAP